MQRPLASLARRLIRFTMRSDRIWELARRLPFRDYCQHQRWSIMQKRARRKFAPYIERAEILSGPFQGLQYAEQTAVGSSLWPKLVGTYESELQPILQEISQTDYRRIVDVGYAEGYYLVGLGRLFRDAELIGFDIETEAERLCRANAKINGIEDERLRLFGAFDGETFQQTLDDDQTLVVVDCEGTENAVISGLKRDQLAAADWLIETHDHLVPGTTDRLWKQLRDTHQLRKIETNDDLEGKLQLLPESIKRGYDTYVQETLVSENRKSRQFWIFAQRKAA